MLPRVAIKTLQLNFNCLKIMSKSQFLPLDFLFLVILAVMSVLNQQQNIFSNNEV